MLWWFVDNANVWQLLLGIAALGFGVAFYVTRRVKFLGGAAALMAGIVLLWLLGKVVVTDRRQLELDLRAMGEAVVEGKPDVLLRHFAADFSFQGRGGKSAATAVVQAARQEQVHDIHLYQFQIEEVSRRDGKARVFFRATAHSKRESPYMAACRAFFVLQQDQWQLKEVHFYNPVVGHDQPMQLPLP